MGEPKTQEAVRPGDRAGPLRLRDTDPVISPNLSTSDENQSKLKDSGDMSWGAAKQDPLISQPQEMKQQDPLISQPQEMKQQDPLISQRQEMKQQDPLISQRQEMKQQDPLISQRQEMKQQDPLNSQRQEMKQQGPLISQQQEMKQQDPLNSQRQDKKLKSRSFLHAGATAGGQSEACPPRPSPSLLRTLQSLGEHNDHTLLPCSLHQIAETYFLEEDYQWAVEFLHLERLYHERLLCNLASLQGKWESQWKANIKSSNNARAKAASVDEESDCMHSLSLLCRTHQRPTLFMEKTITDAEVNHSLRGVRKHTDEGEPKANTDVWGNRMSGISSPQAEEEGEEAEEVSEEEEDDLGQRERECLDEEHQEQLMGEGRQVLPAEELARLIEVEEFFPPDGLVSILKRGGSLGGSPGPKPASSRGSSRRRVRFSDPDHGLDAVDEVTGDSCLILLLLCLVTVVMSMGGTALYCLLGGAHTSMCADFSYSMDSYFGHIHRVVHTVTHWLAPGPS